MSALLSPNRYRRRVADAMRSLRSSSVSIEPLKVAQHTRAYQASQRFRKKMERAGVTTSELLSNLERVKKDLANHRQNQ
jgi:hypothetical protein